MLSYLIILDHNVTSFFSSEDSAIILVQNVSIIHPSSICHRHGHLLLFIKLDPNTLQVIATWSTPIVWTSEPSTLFIASALILN